MASREMQRVSFAQPGICGSERTELQGKKGERPGIHDPEAKTKEVNMPKNLLRAILARTLKLLLKCLCVILLLFWAPNAF